MITGAPRALFMRTPIKQQILVYATCTSDTQFLGKNDPDMCGVGYQLQLIERSQGELFFD